MYLVSFDFYCPSKCGSYFCRTLYLHSLTTTLLDFYQMCDTGNTHGSHYNTCLHISNTQVLMYKTVRCPMTVDCNSHPHISIAKIFFHQNRAMNWINIRSIRLWVSHCTQYHLWVTSWLPWLPLLLCSLWGMYEAEKQLNNEHGLLVYHVSCTEYALRQKEELSISTAVMVTRCHKTRQNTSIYRV